MLLLLALACADPVVDNTEDRYDEQRPGPDALVDADGNYVGGWWSDWTGQINPDDASGPDSALKGWIHLSVETDDLFIVTNIADLSRASNTALLVVDKNTGDFQSRSLRYAFGDNLLEVSPDWDALENPADDSYSRVNDDGTIDFGIFAEDLSFVGSAAIVGQPFIQTTRSVPGYGWLQFFGTIEILEATLDRGDGPVDVPAGTLGSLDRTLGHRSTVQSWNYLSSVGTATNAAGDRTVVSIQVARDKDDATPKIDAIKFPIWVGDDLFKVPDLSFDYEVLDEQTRETGDWHITSPAGEDNALDVTFTPSFQRREQTDFLWFVHTDFNQYYGELSGTISHNGEVWTLEAPFALTEDSLLVL